MENKKALIALALVAIVGVVGATFAYYTSTATVENEFTTGTYGTTVTEVFTSPDDWTPGTTTEKTVNVTNTGNVDIAVRVKYTEKWTAADGTTVLNGERDGERVAQFETGSSWVKGTDGYYYYNANLTQGQTTSNFIDEVTFNPNFELEEGTDIECTTEKTDAGTTVSCEPLTTGYAGATYTLTMTVETIQADQSWNNYELARHTNGIYYDRVYYNEIIDDLFLLHRDNSITYRDNGVDYYEVPIQAIEWIDNTGYVAAYDILFSRQAANDQVIIEVYEGKTSYVDYPLYLTEYKTLEEFEKNE